MRSHYLYSCLRKTWKMYFETVWRGADSCYIAAAVYKTYDGGGDSRRCKKYHPVIYIIYSGTQYIISHIYCNNTILHNTHTGWFAEHGHPFLLADIAKLFKTWFSVLFQLPAAEESACGCKNTCLSANENYPCSLRLYNFSEYLRGISTRICITMVQNSIEFLGY